MKTMDIRFKKNGLMLRMRTAYISSTITRLASIVIAIISK